MFDDVEERLRRHQALMMHRYSKAMRRRSMWDRDGSPKYYGWDHLRARISRSVSSTQAARAKVEEHEVKVKEASQPWREFHNDFESFKQAVDRAIQRDPYGTLFGRRLRSPETTNNASWTSWSWIFDPKEIKEEPKTESGSDKQDSKSADKQGAQSMHTGNDATVPIPSAQTKPAVEHTSSSQRTTTTIRSSQSFIFKDSTISTAEYVYDPITGRKVPQTADAPANINAAKTPRSDFPKWRTAASKNVESTSLPIDAENANVVASPVRATSTSSNHTLPNPSKTGAATQPKGFIETIFGEHDVDIPVKTYKSHKVHGYTAEPMSVIPNEAAKKDSKDAVRTSRQREYDQLRLRTIGNNIDSTNFNAEPWNDKSEDNLPMYNAAQAHAPRPETQKEMQSRAIADQDAPLFSGTTYETKASDILTPKADCLSEGVSSTRQGTTLPTPKISDVPTPDNSAMGERMDSALDRAQKKSPTAIPVKRFESRLQPALDRAVPPSSVLKGDASFDSRLTERGHAEARRAQQGLEALEKQRIARRGAQTVPKMTSTLSTVDSATKQVTTDKTDREEQEKREDIDLLRASDVRAASRSARITQQELQDKKAQDRAGLERNFTASNSTAEDLDLLRSNHVRNATKARMQSDEQLQKLSNDLRSIISENLRPKSDSSIQQPSPKFTEPTVKSGVERDLDVERHTQTFEPKYATLVDSAKAIKKEIQSLQQNVRDVSRATATPPLSAASQVAASSSAENIETDIFDAPMIVLRRDGQSVNLEPHHDTFVTDRLKIQNFTSFLASLRDPGPLLQYFPKLDSMGYELTHGDQTDLFFKKLGLAEITKPDRASMRKNLNRKIAAEEVAAQPSTETVPSRKAADVLGETPAAISTPGPAAPTPPAPASSFPAQEGSSNEHQQRHKKSKSQSRSRVSRQEEVFSGQQRLKPQTTALPDPEHFQKQHPASNTAYSPPRNWRQERTREEYEEFSGLQAWFGGVARIIRRTLITIGAVVALGTGAYGLGVVAEGVQGKKQITQGEAGGPMKRLVLDADKRSGERQRPDIFSMESSR